MRDTTRHISHRRPPLSSPRAKTMTREISRTGSVVAPSAMTRAERVDLLRRLVGAGQYQVSAPSLAARIMSVAGVPALEE
ncbi:MAG TPA: flagellar biosynthesis anti-sigma factor FlgM [Polyangia bacterium]|nr:flagellar biosynthesis anti-sigma factor FlgM [Polyangia bacterium]